MNNENITEENELIATIIKDKENKPKKLGKNVYVNEENIEKINKFKGFLEDDANSTKLKDIQEYIINEALEVYFTSDKFKDKIQEALK